MGLSNLAIKNAKPSQKPYKLSDRDGLYLFVTPKGSKLWRYDYRLFGKRRTFSIGAYPLLSLAEAREECDKARKLVFSGIDPVQDRKNERTAALAAQEATFRNVAEDYLREARKQGLAEVTLWKKEWVLRDLAYPSIGDRPIADIRASEVLELLRNLEAKGNLETAKRTRQTLSGVFRLATIRDLAPGDPTVVLQRAIRAPRVTSHAAIIHEASFGALLRDIDRYERPISRLALQFLALSFPRPVELRMATWDEIDLAEAIWRIPEEHTKMRRPHDVPLSSGSLRILTELREFTGRDEGYVFHSPQSWRKPISENTLNKALALMGYKGRHTSHGFRSSASTILHERGYPDHVIETQLAHLETNGTKRAYNRARYWDERVGLMAEWSKVLMNLRFRT